MKTSLTMKARYHSLRIILRLSVIALLFPNQAVSSPNCVALFARSANSAIEFYKPENENGIFSNFYPSPLTGGGKSWPSAEHYYQAKKTTNPFLQEQIRNAPTAQDAAERGRGIPGVDQNKSFDRFGEMVGVVRLRAEQDPAFRSALLNTGSRQLVYKSYRQNVASENVLGKALMSVRADLRSQEYDRKLERLAERSEIRARRSDYDVIVIGAGPHAAEFVSTLKKKDPSHRVLVLEASSTVSSDVFGALGRFYDMSAKDAENLLPGSPRQLPDINGGARSTAEDFKHVLIEAIESSGTDLLLRKKVVAVESLPDGVRFLTEDNKQFTAPIGVIATGLRENSPPAFGLRAMDVFRADQQKLKNGHWPLRDYENLDVMLQGAGGGGGSMASHLLGISGTAGKGSGVRSLTWLGVRDDVANKIRNSQTHKGHSPLLAQNLTSGRLKIPQVEIETVERLDNGKSRVFLIDRHGQRSSVDVDLLITAQSFEDSGIPFRISGDLKSKAVYSDSPKGRLEVARAFGDRLFAVGPAAQLASPDGSSRPYLQTVPELIERTSLFAQMLPGFELAPHRTRSGYEITPQDIGLIRRIIRHSGSTSVIFAGLNNWTSAEQVPKNAWTSILSEAADSGRYLVVAKPDGSVSAVLDLEKKDLVWKSAVLDDRESSVDFQLASWGTGGSTGGDWYIQKSTGELWFGKGDLGAPELQSGAEMVTAHVYRALGYKTPAMKLGSLGGKRFVFSRKVSGRPKTSSLAELDRRDVRLLRVFATLLKDWDRIGIGRNNFFYENGDLVLFDFGGSLGSRAGGKPKSGEVLSPSIGSFEDDSSGARILNSYEIRRLPNEHPWRQLTHEDYEEALARLNRLTDALLKKAVSKGEYSSRADRVYLFNALKVRRDALIHHLSSLIR